MTSPESRSLRPQWLAGNPPAWLWIVGALLLAIIVLIALWDWNWLKGPVERRVEAATGRNFSIHGDIDVDLRWQPQIIAGITAGDIHLGNAQWSDEDQMATVERLEFRVALLPLLRGRVELPYISAGRPRLLLERNRAGQGNWMFARKEERQPSARSPIIGELVVHDGVLRVHEPTFRTDVRLNVRSGKSAAKDARVPLLASGTGTWRGYPFQLDAQVDSPLALQDKARPYRVDVRARAGETLAHASGALPAGLRADEFNVRFELSGANLADIYELSGIALPDTPPYSLRGELSRKGDTWSYRKFEGKVGDSDLSGDASIDLGRWRPLLTGELVSQQLDFDDLGPLIGATPSAKEGETLSAEQRSLAQRRKESPRVLPDTPFRLDKLRAVDADVTLQAARIEAPKLPLEQMSVHLQLEDGVLKLSPLDFRAAGGRIATRISLNAREPSIQTTAVVEVHELELPKLFPTVEITRKGAGRLSGVAAFTAQGNSIAHMLGSANGDAGMIMGPGRISNLLVELAGLDIAESLKYLLDKDREIPLRCAYANFKVVDGVMDARSLAFDTSDTIIYGQGEIRLRDEGLDLRLLPQPKDTSPVSLRAPLRIGGTFKDPSFRPEAGPLVLRAAAAAALYSVAPPAALLALIETGPGKSIDCGSARAAGS